MTAPPPDAASAGVPLWIFRYCPGLYCDKEIHGDAASHVALPAEDFARMESDARAYHRVLDVIADPRLRDAPIAKTLADLGLDQRAGPAREMWFTMSGGPLRVPPSPAAPGTGD